jgi:hypothetical protein
MSVRLWFIVLAAVLAVAGGVVAVVYVASEGNSQEAAEHVSIELRANPTATIHVDGKKVGTTPMRLQYPKSSRQIVVTATMTRHLVRRGGAKDQVFEDKRTVTLDRDQLLDFTFATATMVEETVQTRE